MALAFGTSDVLEVFAAYNNDSWPAPAVLDLIAFMTVCLVLFPIPGRNRIASLLLASLWIWAGLVYQFWFFARLTPVAYLFAFLFVAQAALIVRVGVFRGDLQFWMHDGSRHLAGILLIFYALVAYPSISALIGHAFPSSPSFGVPCPLTIFTLGMLLLARAPYPRILFAVPMVWAVVGTFLAMELKIREDLALIVAAALVMTMTPTDDDPDTVDAHS
ncbi:MAG: hypothetical protein HY899_19345 [Deltaproteobacteria bacterium]|nr:hypothetical protein [Deltaproteobacteria bacterium]